MPDWMDQEMEMLGQSVPNLDSGFQRGQPLAGAQEASAIEGSAVVKVEQEFAGCQGQRDLLVLSCTACKLQVIPIKQYSWLNEELQVR